MKKLWGIWLALMFLTGLLVFSNDIRAQESGVCGESQNMILYNRDIHISNAFTNYRTYENSSSDAIWLCFQLEVGENIPEINSPLTLINTSGLPVIISGLNIQAGEALDSRTLLRLSGTSPVTVINSSFQNCTNCLSINGNGFQIENVAVVCSAGSAGIGIRLRGNNHVIQGPGTDISKCGVGVQIGVQEASGGLLPGNNIQITDSALYDNGTAIYVLKGTGNYFRGNSIYENDSGDGNYSGIEGILLGSTANGDLTVPALQNGARPIQYAEGVQELLDDDTPVTATLTVQSPFAEGSLEVDLTLRPRESTILSQQGREFYSDGEFLSSSLQADGNYLLTYQIPMRKSLVGKEAVILFHHSTLGTSSYSSSFTMNGPIGVLSAAELEAPGATGLGGTPPAGTGLGATNPGVTNTPSPQEDEKKKDDGHSMAEAGTVASGGLGSGGGVSVGLGKGCGSIVGTGVSNGPVSLDFFLIPLVFLIALLTVRKKTL